MPLASKRSRAAKNARRNAHTVFATPAPHTPSPDGSEYLGSNNSVIDPESGDESNTQAVKSSVEAIQQLYSVFLPPQLRLEVKGQGERGRKANRKAVYSGDSRMTMWRKRKDLKRAAEGCKTLDAFVVRKVCLQSAKQQ